MNARLSETLAVLYSKIGIVSIIAAAQYQMSKHVIAYSSVAVISTITLGVLVYIMIQYVVDRRGAKRPIGRHQKARK